MCLCKRIGQILVMIFIEDSSFMVSQKHHAPSFKNVVFSFKAGGGWTRAEKEISWQS